MAIALGIFLYGNNASWLAGTAGGRPMLLANRGMAQSFPHTNVAADACTARTIAPSKNTLIENTIPAFAAAFATGADIVEFQVHETADGQFAVFHDWTLDCRTNGHGETRAQTMAALKMLDVGYGYTADGGKTFPLRGKGIGLMPSLDDVLAAFPGRRFLIALKSNDPSEAADLAGRLQNMPLARRRLLMVLVPGHQAAASFASVDGVRVMDQKRIKSCFVRYLALGWSGYVPQACRETILMVPLNYAGLLWGWPNRLLARLRGVNSLFFVAGDYRGGSVGGIDTPAQVKRLPKNYSGGIWTDEIGFIGPLVKPR